MNEILPAVHATARLEVISEINETLDELASLRLWLSNEPELRGSVTPIERPLAEGAMGGVADALAVAIGSGGALTILTTSVSTWLRTRRSTISIKLTRPDGTAEIISASGPAADAVAGTLDREIE